MRVQHTPPYTINIEASGRHMNQLKALETRKKTTENTKCVQKHTAK